MFTTQLLIASYKTLDNVKMLIKLIVKVIQLVKP
jgi:hypothetical protein